MTKIIKAELLKRFETELERIDFLIAHNADANTQSLLEEYRKIATLLARIREAKTSD
ncbi:MAG: hypothetical protein ACOYOA_16225 [Saprospiraceae bacterium]